MVNELEIMPMPDWLKSDIFEFNLINILKDSLYYPCSGLDGNPVKYLMGNFYSFIYVDYGIEKGQLFESIENIGFKGYQVL